MTMAETVTTFSAEEIIKRVSWLGLIIIVLGFLVYLYAEDLAGLARKAVVDNG